jgi:hypothetical protein
MILVVDGFVDKLTSHPKNVGEMWDGTSNLEESLNIIGNAFC